MAISHQMKLKPIPLTLAVAMLLVGLTPLLLLGHANAAPDNPFQIAFVRLDSLNATTGTGGRVCAKPSVVNLANTEASVQVKFPTTGGTDYIVNATAANWTVNTSNLDTGQTAWPGIATATTANAGTKIVTFPSTDLSSSSTLYCFNFAAANTLTTSSAGAAETTQGTITTRTSTPTDIDQTTYSESIISNDNVVVTAVVPPSFTFVLSGNTDSFTTNLSTGSVVSTSGRTITLTTNAASGWIVWAMDSNFKTVSDTGSNPANEHGALKSTTAANYVISNNTTNSLGTASHTLTTGSEDYGLGVTINTDAAGGGVVSLDAAYDGTSTKAGVLDPTHFRPVATASGTANGDIINLNERATIAGQTPAASDYTDTITFVGAGVF